jgi:phage tail sheath protein FI
MTQPLSPGVYVREMEPASRPIEGVGTAIAAFVGLAEAGPINEPTLVSNWTQFTSTFGGFVAGAYLAHSVYGYFQNGGGNCYVVRIGGDGSANGRGGRRAAARPELPTAEGQIGGFKVTAVEAGTDGGGIAVEIRDPEAENPPDGSFKIVVRQGPDVKEEFDHLTTGRGRQNVVTVVNQQSKLIRIEELTREETVTRGTVELAPPAVPVPIPGQRLDADDYVGDVADRTGFSGLEAIEDITMVVVPDLMSAYQRELIDLETVQAVQKAIITHCELMGDRIAILDAPPGLSPQQVREWLREEANYDSKYATLYWPWIKVADPAINGTSMIPPSGHIAGIWGRNDDTRGVHKAPANEIVRGALTLEMQITSKEQEGLNQVGINCLRSFPGRGIRVWGARTLSSDAAWRYLNVRRLFNYLEESILSGTQWVVFEPNDPALWARIRRTISAFLVNEWRRGALFGRTADEAFYVKCDDETNPSEGIDAGQVLCEVGVAPVKPAEFVIFQLSQFSGGTSIVSE